VNFATLPDFVAIGTLVGIFFSLLRRNSHTRLHYLFVGWLLILGHFVSRLFAPTSPVATASVDFVSIATLLLASVAFIWAARAREGTYSEISLRMLAAALPTLVYFAYDQLSGTSPAIYVVLSVAGFLLTLAAAELARPRRFRVVDATAILVVYAGEALIAVNVSPDASTSWMLCCAYFAAAVSFWRNAETKTIGTIATTWAFVLWGLVFPAGELLDRFAPAVHVDPEVWNLPKFLAASAMILALLEDQLVRNEQLALEDDLTGLPNRRLYEDRLTQSLSQARRNGQRVAFFSIDVDRFKEVNDTLGHVAGDEVLRLLASRFATALRETDTLARTGGDEFGAIVTGVPDRSTAHAIASALHESLALPIVVADRPLNASVSVGVAIFPDDGTEAATLKMFADREMYREKRARANVA